MHRVVWEIPEQEIPGGKSWEIRDGSVNTGNYKKNTLLNGYFFPIKKSMKLKYQSLTYTPKIGSSYIRLEELNMASILVI